MGPRDFAHNEYREVRAYTDLAAREKNPEFKKILERLVQHESSHFLFWKTLAGGVGEYQVSEWTLVRYRLIRKVLGITFFAKLLERDEHDAVKRYEAYVQTVTDSDTRAGIQKIIDDEKTHERGLIDLLREEKVSFTGSIVLGLNDGLIELTGALVGFTSAFHNNQLVLMTGFITGVSASLSMAASAFMQEKHEQGEDAKNPRKSAMYTGISYIIVVLLMIAPFMLPVAPVTALCISFGVVVVIVAAISYYTAVLFDWKFSRQFIQMFSFSVGVATVAYVIGTIFRAVTGISV